MTVELACLVLNALWGLGLVFLEIGAKTRTAGTAWNAGNRETSPDVPPWVQRAGRALGNHKENFPLFATAIVVLHLVGRSDAVTAAAAITYVAARALHALIYVAGIKGLRSAVFGVGLLATLVLYAKLLG